tara:strand:+ start:398 stop:2065 length:1668 start_codon:yes stop_codon:yes gene_type:complete
MSIFEKNMDYLIQNRDSVLKTDKAKQYFDTIIKDLNKINNNTFNRRAGAEEYGPVPGRCRKGFKKNKQTKMCEKKETKESKNSKSDCKGLSINECNKNKDCTFISGSKKQYCRKNITKEDVDEYGPVVGRCRNGYHKNKTSKKCVKKNITLKKHILQKKQSLPPTQIINPKSKLITVKDSTPKPLQQLSHDIKTALKTKKNIDITKLKSYSPEINQQLITKTASDKIDIFGNCKVLERYSEGQFPAKNVIKPKIWNGKKCVDFTLNIAQTVLLQNLASRNIQPVANIISPKQILSNCWFNTLYMIFFISDKGRKFFKFFRQLMIQGKTAMGKSIPPKLWKSFAILNLAIEGTLTGYNDTSKFNTNTLIGSIYRDIPAKYRKENIKKVGEAGNPLDYYQTIVRYLGADKIMSIYEIDYFPYKLLQKISKSAKAPYYLDKKVLPEVIILRLFPNEKPKLSQVMSFQNPNNDKATYQIDSVAIIDTQRQHFCCLITYDKEEYGFDGASFKRLNPFKWKKLINRNQEWTFEGSNFNNNPATPIKWNFRNGYREVFYYRV